MSRILVIDDDRSVRHLIAKAFDDSDVEVAAAATAEEGLHLLSELQSRRRIARYSAARKFRPGSVRANSRRRQQVAGDLHHVAVEQRNGDQGHDAGSV